MRTNATLRLTTLILALLLATFCGNNAVSDPTPVGESTPVTETETETELAEYTSPGADYEGATFANAANEFKQPVLVGETFIDYCLMNGDGLRSILTAGMLVDLQTISTLDVSHTWWDAKSVEEFTLGKTLYTVTGDISLLTSFAPITYFFNKELIKDHSLEDPYTLVQEGKWTIDKSKEMAYAVVNDVNGNGQVDIEEDVFGICWESNSMIYAIHSADVTLTKKDSDGYPYIEVDQERAASVVEKIASLLQRQNGILACRQH